MNCLENKNSRIQNISAEAPLSADEFSHLLQNLAPLSDKIAVAVSGGGDSMALALCVKRWEQRPCVALIVDHGLRAESAEEAEQVKARLEQIGLQAEILRWKHDPVTGRVHEKARSARYQLLTAACRRHGATDLLLAHHRDDQAETILMRLAKGSGVEGLAGMAAQSLRDGIRLLRPFLSVPKTRLIATCQAGNLPFITDPSNKSEKYARGRLRNIMPLLATEGMTVESLVTLGERAAEVKNALNHYTQAFLRDAAQIDRGGSIRIDRMKLCEAPRATALRALTSCLRFIHEDDYAPEQASLAALFDTLLDKTQEKTRTIYGCLCTMTANKITLLREPSAATETLALSAGETKLWDRRWLVTASKEAPTCTIRALDMPPHDILDRLSPNLRHDIPQGRIRATLPALWEGNTLRAIPSFDENGDFWMKHRKELSFPE